MTKHAFTLMCSLAVLVAVLAAWQWLPGLLGTPEYIWPKFTSVVDEFFRMW
ncbi:MAG: ABC transporter permease, partial [Alcaligenaceae bacterium]|nr:ABC transporter permease [Alcaligenaceae bacterium]